jgi:hypothetical protein
MHAWAGTAAVTARLEAAFAELCGRRGTRHGGIPTHPARRQEIRVAA